MVESYFLMATSTDQAAAHSAVLISTVENLPTLDEVLEKVPPYMPMVTSTYEVKLAQLPLLRQLQRNWSKTGRFDQPDRSEEKAWPHPVIANGKLYLRDQDILLCYDVKKN